MPIYEYRCLACRRRFSVFYRSFSAVAETATCPRCGGMRTERLISRVTVLRGRADAGDFEEAKDSLDEELGAEDEDWPPLDEEGFPDTDDPRELAQWTRRMSEELGEPLDPVLDQALTDLERGADPDEVFERLEAEPPAESPGETA
ncbi:hypothetical protein HRbin26_01998 [bacterium HR26]|nr:hypothetical protein HRbin26_01998 [bacterium HR26]